MERDRALAKIFEEAPSPSYVIDKAALRRNLAILGGVKERTGGRILLALKAFSMWGVFGLLRQTLDGTSGSSLFEVRLGAEEFGGEVHACCTAYGTDEAEEIARLADHVVFNSLGQYQRFGAKMRAAGDVSCGLRVNPGHSEAPAAIYDPCAAGSRLGITAEALGDRWPEGAEGLHFHTLCEKNADALKRTLEAVEEKFGRFLDGLEWVNLGGGHHITREGYDVELLCGLVTDFKERYGVEVYLEPGEAVALNAGWLVATVLDVVHNEADIAVLDTSASAHMPDVLEMPYRPHVEASAKAGEKEFTYRLAGMTCLAGDVIGDYSFDEPLEVGSRVAFTDMAHYTMVKNTMFNGVRLPDIVVCDSDTGRWEILRHFTFEDFKARLS
jgi:carboxynorspermidine decarboxylase